MSMHVFLALAAPSLAVPAQSLGPGSSGADVTAFRVSADSTRVVYLADARTDETFELFAVPVTGGAALRPSPHPVMGGDVTAFELSPDSRHVVFLGDLEADGVFELYSSSLLGRAPERLSPALVAGGDVLDFAIAPDSRHVVLRADAERDRVPELYVAPLPGGPARKLNAPLPAGHVVGRYLVAEGTGRVVYATRDAQGDATLHSVPLAGGAPVELTPGLGLYTAVDEGSFQVAAKRVVLTLSSLGNSRRLYHVPLRGGTLLELSPPDVERVRSFAVRPDGACVLYVAAPSGAENLYSVPLPGGPASQVNAPLLAGEKVAGFALSPDGEWVLYKLEVADGCVALYSVPRDRPPVELARPMDGQVLGGTITPDSRRVLMPQVLPDSFDLWSTAIGGGGATPLLADPATIRTSAISPDSRHFVCVSGFPTSELFRFPIEGGPAVRLSPDLVPGGNVQEMRLTPDSRFVVYSADQDVDETVELYGVPLAGGTPVQLNPEFQVVP